MLLSIFIPTFQREYKFKRLYKKICSVVSKDIELVVACSSPEYIPKDNIYNVHCYCTKGFTREENYLFGINKCLGLYTLIIEDDDLIDTNVLLNFIKSPYLKNHLIDIYFFDIINHKYTVNRLNTLIRSQKFLDIFYTIYGNSFQWGQCITKTSLLKYYMNYIWVENSIIDLVQSDELITLLILKEGKYTYVSDKRLLYIGIGNDNYSWNNELEVIQKNKFVKLINKFIYKI